MTVTTQKREDGFPSGFLWGASTSSFQIEGASAADGRGDSVWDAFARRPGAVVGGSGGEPACGSYHRYREDVELLRGLGVGAYRFSLAWPRIQPEGRGRPNRAGIDYYRRLAGALLEAGIEPWACLYHWDHPQRLEEEGGWPSRDMAYRYAEYAEICFRELGDLVSTWLTLNEPWCSAILGYAEGIHAPGRRELPAAYAAVHHLLLGHGLALAAFRKVPPRGALGKEAAVGLALNLAKPRNATGREEDLLASERASEQRTALFMDPLFGRGYPERHLAAFPGLGVPVVEGDLELIAAPIDFLGVNYYNEDVVEAVPPSAAHPEGFRASADWRPRTEMDWAVAPLGLLRLLRFVHGRWAPKVLYVTENGAAYADRVDAEGRIRDRDRIAYLDAHVAACERALAEGIPLRGYFVWSLLDNFEWSFGYTRRFGLVHVDFGSQVRRPKDSYYWYRDLVAGHGHGEPA